MSRFLDRPEADTAPAGGVSHRNSCPADRTSPEGDTGHRAERVNCVALRATLLVQQPAPVAYATGRGCVGLRPAFYSSRRALSPQPGLGPTGDEFSSLPVGL